MKQQKLSVGAKWMLVALQKEQDKRGKNFEMTLTELEELAGVSRPTVIRYKQQLIEVGLLEETEQYASYGGRLPNRFIVKEVQL